MLFFLLSLQTAWPCAALVTTSSGAIATSDAQEVILERTDTGTRTRYRVSYDGDADHFGWLIVVHGQVGEGDVTEADAFAFDDLREATQPRTETYGIGSGGGGGGCMAGCSGFASKGGDGAGNDFLADTGDAIDIVAEGYAGPFHYQVLDAEEPEALTAWLDDNDFELGGTATTLGEYVTEGGFSFVAVTLTPDDAVTPSEGRILPALAIESDSDTLHYPARMALTGMAEEVRTTVWLIGDTEAQAIEGWDSEPVYDLEISGDDTAEETYDTMLRAMASRDTPTYMQVYSQSLDGNWVTRLDTLAHRSVHTVDPQFDFMADSTENQMVIVKWGAASEAAAWLILPLLGAGWARRRRA